MTKKEWQIYHGFTDEEFESIESMVVATFKRFGKDEIIKTVGSVVSIKDIKNEKSRLHR